MRSAGLFSLVLPELTGSLSQLRDTSYVDLCMLRSCIACVVNMLGEQVTACSNVIVLNASTALKVEKTVCLQMSTD